MSKQKKSKGHSGVERANERDLPASSEVDPALVEQQELGNAALQQQLGPTTEAAPRVALDMLRDVAFPMIERAMLSLQLTPRDAGQVDRFLDILDRSHLPEDRKATLMERIRSDQEMALGIQGALQRSFGGHDDDVRADLGAALEGMWSGLLTGEIVDDGARWQLGAGEAIELSGGVREGTLDARAEALVGDLAGALATDAVRERAGGDASGAVTRFCRAVSLALVLDEEEDEDGGLGLYDLEG